MDTTTSFDTYLEHTRFSICSVMTCLVQAAGDAMAVDRGPLLVALDALSEIESGLATHGQNYTGRLSEECDAFMDFLANSHHRIIQLAGSVAHVDWLLEYQLGELAEEFRHLTPHLLLSLLEEPVPQFDAWSSDLDGLVEQLLVSTS